MSGEVYDVVVIGAGSTGENVAGRVTKRGLTAVVVESDLVGGACSFWACVPSKALLRPLQALADARAVAGARENVPAKPDVAAVLGRRDAFAAHWDDAGQVQWLRDEGIDLVRGVGHLTGERRVAVANESSGRMLTTRHAKAI